MPLVLADRVRDTTTTTGTGTVTLSGTAPTGYQNFSVIGNGNTTYYTINAGSQWEVGIGTYSSTGPTLARTTVLKSSNANALVSFSAGTKDVFVTYPADEVVIQDGATIQAGTSVLAVANGGTGVTTSTGTGSVVLSTSPTLTTPNLGTPSAATLTNATGLPIVAGTTGTLSVARGGTGVTTSTGTGNVVLSTSPALTTPNLGTPSAATLTNATGLPIVAGTTGTLSVARGGTGVTTSTGTGNVVLSTSPTLVTPTLGAASATSIAAALGAVGTPSYTFTGDTNTGMWSPAADTLAFSEGGVEVIRINSSSNVGIGTSSPSEKLTVAGRVRSAVSSGTTDIYHDGTNGSLASNTQLLIYAGGANNMIFHTNGIERFRITSTGSITSADLADAVGYKGIPQNTKTAAYTLALSDIGKHISITTGGVTIPANGTVAFPVGSAVTIYNNSASNQTISITTDTLRLAGTATTGSRTLAQRGICTCVKVAATEWVISGAGLT